MGRGRLMGEVGGRKEGRGGRSGFPVGPSSCLRSMYTKPPLKVFGTRRQDEQSH